MGQMISFRFATQEDIPEILELIKGLASYEKEPESAQATPELLKEWMFEKQTAETILVTHAEKGVVGCAVFYSSFSTWTGKEGMYLEDLFIEEEFRGLGAGRLLMAQLAQICKERGWVRLDWTCSDWNVSSLEFYRSIGAEKMAEYVHHRLSGQALELLAAEPLSAESSATESLSTGSLQAESLSTEPLPAESSSTIERDNMGTCALVGAVYFNVEHFQLQEFDYIIAVDGGYKHLEQAGVVPNIVMGDFDSLGYVPPNVKVEKFPSHKNKSDIEIAFEHAVEQGFETLVVYGCLSGRLDHTYGVTQLIGRFSKEGCQVWGIGDTFAITALTGGKYDSLSFSDRAQGTLSLFSFDETVQGVDEIGLEYLLDKATLRNNEPLGVSNMLIKKPARIAIEEGTVLVFFPLQAWDHIIS